uniref:Putative zinc finger protein 91-like n=1 Tax=Davidia involucrata TaxID=16924 RepID=A0A5B6YU58_DAVIN
MERDQELKYVCKLCNKRYPCGKSLGGHMRSHLIPNSAQSKKKVEHKMKKVSSMNGGSSGYGLRENPKKTWRVVDSNHSTSTSPLQQEKVCKQCGKAFQSLKALCGHMACHSEKEKGLKDDHSWTSENQKPVMDSQSESDSEVPNLPKRPPSKRYKSSFSLANGSSSVSGIEQEQEEVAMCLMMLSRDSGNWGAESSDTDSVVLETKSSSIDMRISRNEAFNCTNCICNGGENVEIKKLGGRKLESGALDAELVQVENSDSGYFRNEAKKVESDGSVDGFLRNDEYKKPKVDNGTRFKVSDAELGKGLKRLKCKDLIKEKRQDEAGIASNSTKYESRKRTRNDSYDPKVCNMNNNNPIAQDLSCNVGRKFKPNKSKGHECPICLRVFKSGQALGGHKRSHFLGGSEEKSNQTTVIKQELHDLLDLNLPPPVEDEANEHAQFLPW